jgi:hypothetical protein
MTTILESRAVTGGVDTPHPPPATQPNDHRLTDERHQYGKALAFDEAEPLNVRRVRESAATSCRISTTYSPRFHQVTEVDGRLRCSWDV